MLGDAKDVRNWTYFGDAFDLSGDSKDPLVDAGNDLANASFDTGLLAQISDVLPCFPYDNASILCTDESAESQSVMSRR
jgi:hypothetical protein